MLTYILYSSCVLSHHGFIIHVSIMVKSLHLYINTGLIAQAFLLELLLGSEDNPTQGAEHGSEGGVGLEEKHSTSSNNDEKEHEGENDSSSTPSSGQSGAAAVKASAEAGAGTGEDRATLMGQGSLDRYSHPY